MWRGFRFPACLRSYGGVWESPRFENSGCGAVWADMAVQACLELSESASHQALVPHPVSHTGITSLSPCSSTAALKTNPANSSIFLVVRWQGGGFLHFAVSLQLFPRPPLCPFLEMLFFIFLNILRLLHLSWTCCLLCQSSSSQWYIVSNFIHGYCSCFPGSFTAIKNNQLINFKT